MALHYRGSSVKRLPVVEMNLEAELESKRFSIRYCANAIQNGCYNSKSLQELLHRRGLNMRDEFLVLSKIRDKAAASLVEVDILGRCFKNYIQHK